MSYFRSSTYIIHNNHNNPINQDAILSSATPSPTNPNHHLENKSAYSKWSYAKSSRIYFFWNRSSSYIWTRSSSWIIVTTKIHCSIILRIMPSKGLSCLNEPKSMSIMIVWCLICLIILIIQLRTRMWVLWGVVWWGRVGGRVRRRVIEKSLDHHRCLH